MDDERTLERTNFVFFGGTAGIGQAAAVDIARRRANVLAVGRDPTAGAATVARLRQAGAASADFLRGDLSTIAGVKQAADGVLVWKPALHGVLHSAMSAHGGKHMTPDGLEFSFALQYMARAVLNRLLVDALSASGDGRIVHISGGVGEKQLPDLDDLQYERTKWTFFRSALGSHALSFLHIQEAARQWAGGPVTIAASCVWPTRTKVMLDPKMPLIMRILGMVGTKPEISARNAVTTLVKSSAGGANGRAPQAQGLDAERLAFDPAKAAKLWDITTQLAADHGVTLR